MPGAVLKPGKSRKYAQPQPGKSRYGKSHTAAGAAALISQERDTRHHSRMLARLRDSSRGQPQRDPSRHPQRLQRVAGRGQTVREPFRYPSGKPSGNLWSSLQAPSMCLACQRTAHCGNPAGSNPDATRMRPARDRVPAWQQRAVLAREITQKAGNLRVTLSPSQIPASTAFGLPLLNTRFSGNATGAFLHAGAGGM